MQFARLIAFVFIFSGLFFGCGKDEDSSPAIISTEIRVVNLMEDAYPIDVLLDDSLALRGFPFSEITPYLRLYAGLCRIRINLTGNNSILVDTAFVFTAGSRYTVCGFGNSMVGQAAYYLDNGEVYGHNPKIRLINHSPDSGLLGLYYQYYELIADSIPYLGASDYHTIDRHPVNLIIFPQVQGGIFTEAARLNELELMDGSKYTVIAYGLVDSLTFTAKLYFDE